MSAPLASISCTLCGYQRSDWSCYGARSYVEADRKVTVGVVLGWCFHCDDVMPVEALPTEERRQALERTVRSHDAIAERGSTGSGAGSTTFGGKFSASFHRWKLKSESDRLLLLAGRRSGPRCLECGSLSVQLFPEDTRSRAHAARPGFPVNLGIQHPGCGGMLLGCLADLRVWPREDEILYDLEGNRITSAAGPGA